jgi:hypothetical protein
MEGIKIETQPSEVLDNVHEQTPVSSREKLQQKAGEAVCFRLDRALSELEISRNTPFTPSSERRYGL